MVNGIQAGRGLQDVTAVAMPIPTARLQRAHGIARVAFAAGPSGRGARLTTLYQEGQVKARVPKVYGGPAEAVFINTAGGITGGDRFETAFTVEDGATAVATSQAAERLYRSPGGAPGVVHNQVVVGAHADAGWLPQETIVFDGAALNRTLTIDVAETARLVAVESVVLGRAAMGERVRQLHLTDQWRVTRGGRLVFADATRLIGDPVAVLSGRATGWCAGEPASAFATVLLMGPDVEARLDAARDALGDLSGLGGASAWNGLMVVRLLSPNGSTMRRDLAILLPRLMARPLPRVWSL
jgi:urease accessory protein